LKEGSFAKASVVNEQFLAVREKFLAVRERLTIWMEDITCKTHLRWLLWIMLPKDQA
jgi:hypothetical protein